MPPSCPPGGRKGLYHCYLEGWCAVRAVNHIKTPRVLAGNYTSHCGLSSAEFLSAGVSLMKSLKAEITPQGCGKYPNSLEAVPRHKLYSFVTGKPSNCASKMSLSNGSHQLRGFLIRIIGRSYEPRSQS